MNILKLLISVFVILLGHSVWSDDLDDIRVNSQYVPRTSRQRYKFNHPPAAEIYQAIPVVVVYDEGSRDDKSLKANVTTTNYPAVKERNIKTKSFDKTATLTTNAPKIPINNIEVKTSSKEVKNETMLVKSNTKLSDEVQIPVAVIYDEPQVVQNSRKSSTRVRGFTLSKIEGQGNKDTPSVVQVAAVTKSEVKENISKDDQRPQTQKENGNRTSVRAQEKKTRNSRTKVEEKQEVEIDKASTKVDNITPKSVTENESKIAKQKRQRDPVVPIIESQNHVYSQNGGFQYSYEGGDGTKAFSKGELKSFDDDRTGEAVVGGFSYKDKEGNDFSLSYTADENGYRPVGAHLPTPPPIPAAIARALRYLATKPTPEPVTEVSKYDKSTKDSAETVSNSTKAAVILRGSETKIKFEKQTKTITESSV